jgi:CRP-like cAMP-binding protein
MESLSELEKYTVQHKLAVRRCKPGEYIFTEGTAAKGVFLVLDNHVKIQKLDPKGNVVFLWFAKPQELIGLTSFFQSEQNYTCSAISGDKSCDVIFFPKNEFEQLLDEYPLIKHSLLKILCDRIRFMEIRTKNILYQSTDERIIETLLFLAEKERKENNIAYHKSQKIYFTMRELSEMTGTSIEYLRKRIKELKNKQLIDYGRSWLLINNLNKLKMMLHH